MLNMHLNIQAFRKVHCFPNFGTGFAIYYINQTLFLKISEMKKFLITLILLALFGSSTALRAQYQSNESLGLPGDNLNLYAVMKLFQESETLEGFEKNLNDQNSHINNLDLNGDNMVDYIKVIDNVDGDVHTIVLQVAINKRENQDVAVFTVQRFSDGQVRIQLIGDEALYGKDYIIEPNYADANAGQTPNPGYMGNNNSNGQNVTIVTTTPYEVAVWPVIRFIYMPNYVSWHSSWYYDYYPSYWNPWHPYYWDYYYGYQYNWNNDYYSHYRRTQQFRYTHYNDFYYSSRRAHSPNVSVRIKEGDYKSTYSRPDQRKDGEDLYKRTNPGQNSRRSDQPSGTNAGSRTNTNSSTERPSSGNNVNRRSTNTGTTRPETRQAPQQNNNTPSRSSNTGTTRPETRQAPQQNNNTPRQSTNTGKSQPETRQAPQQNNNTPSRSSNTRTTRPETRQAPQQNTGNTRSVPASATNKSESRPAPASVPETRTIQRSNSNQPERSVSQQKAQKSAPPATNTSSRKPRTETKSVQPAKPSKPSREAEPSKPDRRN